MQLDNKKPWLGLMLSVWLGVAGSLAQCAVPSDSEPLPQANMAVQQRKEWPRPTLTMYNWPNNDAPLALVHVVTIPPDYPVEVAIGDQLKTVEEFAADTGAVAVLNGGFFDPNNGETTSFITINGELVADPRHNRGLIENPDLAAYMDKILNRSEFRRYDCGGAVRYDITLHNAPFANGCTLHSALGAGPQLLPDTAQAEGFTDYADGNLTRDAIGSQQRNARSAIGIKRDGTLLWAMVAQTASTNGMTLAELTQFMATVLAAEKALNLDGGSSSSLYVTEAISHNGLTQSYYGRLDQNGNTIQRPVKSVLLMLR